MLKKVVKWFGDMLGPKVTPKPVPPAPAPIPVIEDVDPVEEMVSGFAAEMSARIEELRVLEETATTDSLRGKYRHRREEVESWREHHAKALDS